MFFKIVLEMEIIIRNFLSVIKYVFIIIHAHHLLDLLEVVLCSVDLFQILTQTQSLVLMALRLLHEQIHIENDQ